MDRLIDEAVHFGPFKLRQNDCILMRRREGDEGWMEIPLRRKAFDLLKYMAENPGRLLAAEELLSQVWPKIHVQAGGLKGYVLHIRTVLGDDPNAPTYIETVRGRGYRFIAPIAVARESLQTGARGQEHRGNLVGRSVARRELETLLRRAEAGEAQLGFITGEAGIGKTVLVDDFLAEMKSETIVAVSRCLPGSAESDAYYPVLDMLSQIARIDGFAEFLPLLSQIAPTWLVQLPWLMTDNLAGGARQAVYGATPHRMMRELCDLLDALAKQRLLILVFEDIHWADQSTLDLINAIATRRLQTRFLLLSTLRMSGSSPPEKSARTLCQTLSLYRLGKEVALVPLTLEHVGEYLTAMGGSVPPQALCVQLHERSEGNPLFMSAILDHFFQAGLVALGSEGWTVTGVMPDGQHRAPPSLARIIEAEVEKLDPESQEVLRAASIAEGAFSAATNHAATGLGEEAFEDRCDMLARATALLRRSELVTLPNGQRVQSYVFRHMIYREVVYERQTASWRAAAHLAIGRHMEQLCSADFGAMASSLARHFIAAQQWAGAITYLRLTARNALKRFSTRDAAAMIEQALGFTVNLPAAERIDAEVELLEDLARIYAGSLDTRAMETYEKLAAAAVRSGRLEIECRALLGLGFTLAWVDLDKSLALLSEAVVRSAALSDPLARARVRTFAHGWRCWASGWSEPDAVAFAEAFEEVRRSGDLVALNASYVDYTLLLFPSSRHREAHDLIASAFEFLLANGFEQRADLSLPLWILRLGKPLCLIYAGEFGKSLELFRFGVRSFLDNNDVGRATTLQFYEGFLHVHMHDYEGALRLCTEAVAFCDAHGSVRLTPNEQQIEMVVRGLAALGLGQVDEAIHLLGLAREAMEKRRTLTTWHWRLALEWGTADAYLAIGEMDGARQHSEALWTLAQATRERNWRALAGESVARVALSRGELTLAADRLREAWDETLEGELPLVSWRLHAVEAMLMQLGGDAAGRDRHRQASAAALETLAGSLPQDHPGRATLAKARTIIAPAFLL